MELTLVRISNISCWCYGSLSDCDEWICDTLEMGDKNCLPDGVYNLQLGTNTKTNERVIEVLSEFGIVISRFIKDNLTVYKNISMRQSNANICIGLKINTPLLVMDMYVEKILLHQVHAAIWSKEKCQLIIKTDQRCIIER